MHFFKKLLMFAKFGSISPYKVITNKQMLQKCFCQNYICDFAYRNNFNSQNVYHFSLYNNKTCQKEQELPIIASDVTENRSCSTYATANQYKFINLVEKLSKDTHFKLITLPFDAINACIFSVADNELTKVKEYGYIVLFRAGVISFWNTSEQLIKVALRIVQNYEIESYKVNIVKWEKENMHYKYVNGKSRFKKNSFELSNSGDLEKLCCDIYAFSYALMASVKLAHWEHSLDIVVRSIESLPRAFMEAKSLNRHSSKNIIRKLGEVLIIRHRLNLQYNMLDVPDEFWDEEELESLYSGTTQFFNIRRRVVVMNEKLSYCCHVIELVKSQIAENKTIRIEMWIVALILIEVLFELFHFYVKPYLDKQTSDKN